MKLTVQFPEMHDYLPKIARYNYSLLNKRDKNVIHLIFDFITNTIWMHIEIKIQIFMVVSKQKNHLKPNNYKV